MKKKIILFLSVLLVAMFLTGCSITIYPESLEKSNEVANEIAKKIGEYKLPEGYEMSQPNPKDTSIFCLASETGQEDTLKAYYQISNKEAKLLSYNVDDNNDVLYIFIVALIFAVGLLVGHESSKS